MNLLQRKFILRKPSSQGISLCLVYVITMMIACWMQVSGDHFSTYVLYISVITASLLFAILAEQTRGRISDYFFWTGIIVMATVMAFRNQTGMDDGSYKAVFLQAGNYDLITYLSRSGIEKGYLFLNYILYYVLNGDYDIAQIIISYFTFFLWGNAIRKRKEYSNLPILVLLIWTHYYFQIMGAGLVRIYIAIPIAFGAIEDLTQGKKGKYTLTILFASLFHLSSLMMLVLLVFYVRKEWLVQHWKMAVALLLILIPFAYLFVARFVAPMLSERYQGYAIIRSFKVNFGNFDVLPVFAIGVIYLPRIEREHKKKYVMGLILCALSVIFSLYSSMVSLGRLVFYANLGILVVFSEICKSKPHRPIEYFMPFILLVYSVIYMFHTSLLNSSMATNLFPYVNIWGWRI